MWHQGCVLPDVRVNNKDYAATSLHAGALALDGCSIVQNTAAASCPLNAQVEHGFPYQMREDERIAA